MIELNRWWKIFLKSNEELIKNEDIQRLYARLTSSGIYSNEYPMLTEILYSVGVNPLHYLKTIPYKFLDSWQPEAILTIPDNIQAIGYTAIRGVTLKKLIIGKGIQWMRAFSIVCSEIDAIYLPNTIKGLDADTFSGCNILTLYFDGTEEEYLNLFTFYDTSMSIEDTLTYLGFKQPSGISIIFNK